MSFNLYNNYSLNLIINNKPLEAGALGELIIHESIHQALPTVDITFVTTVDLIETDPLVDGSQIDVALTVEKEGITDEVLRLETLLWSNEITQVSGGVEVTLHCFLSAPDFLNGRIESVNGSSLEVFEKMAERSRMQLISDVSIDKQVWIRPGIKGNLWLNDVINHSWASPESAFVYAVTRNRELLRYNLTERAAKDPTWVFIEGDGSNNQESNVVNYKFPKLYSQAGFLNTFFGYGRNLSTFNVDQGQLGTHKPASFIKRTNFMNLNSTRETAQKHGSLGFNNSLNVHEKYFDAYAQNMRLKSFYSLGVEVMSSVFREVKLLDRVAFTFNNENSPEVLKTYAGNYFVEKISTVIEPTNIVRRFSLIREGFNAEKTAALNSK